MTLQGSLILLTPPGARPPARPNGLVRGRLCYRLGPGGQLLRSGSAPPKGGLLAVDDAGYDAQGSPERMCAQLLRQCTGHGFCGIVCLFSSHAPVLARLAALLDGEAARRSLALYVPETLGECTKRARVMISSALSGGSLAQRLKDSARHFGGVERLALLLEPMAEEFLLPSPTGSGRRLDRAALSDCARRHGAAVFFSEELCLRYFTFMDANGARFVLFDDAETLCRKLQLARQLGIQMAVGHAEALSPFLDRMAAMDF